MDSEMLLEAIDRIMDVGQGAAVTAKGRRKSIHSHGGLSKRVLFVSELAHGTPDEKLVAVTALAKACHMNGGIDHVLNVVDQWKDACNARYRFQPLIDELIFSKDNARYTTVLFKFLNALLVNVDSPHDRVRLRYELIGLQLRVVIEQLR
ncbi:unnamed protein product [Soboliphyme baturini]|uniref:Drf_FH3 domain-containing protein n=1 Tax=Soboliphyme baturini TaxID=241478 RepID=A0A183IZD4_9BILA|nr:unnamed protein product [Soboliphyme baturini]